MIIFRGRLCDLSRDRQVAFRILLSVAPQAPMRSRLDRSRAEFLDRTTFGNIGDPYELGSFLVRYALKKVFP